MALIHNPFFAYADMRWRIARLGSKYLYRAWYYVCAYSWYRAMKRDTELQRIAQEVETKLLQKSVQLLSESPDDRSITIASIVATILVDRGVQSRQLEVLISRLREAIRGFLEDLTEMRVNLSSIIVSRALGMALSLSDKMDRETSENLDEILRRECTDTATPRPTLCIYAILGLSLQLLRREEQGVADRIQKMLSKLQELSIDTLPENLLVDLLLAIGIVRRVAKDSSKLRDLYRDLEPMALRTYKALERSLAKRVWVHEDLTKTFWLKFVAALRLNELDKLAYVPRNYIPMPRHAIKKCISCLEVVNPQGMRKNLKRLIGSIVSFFSAIILQLIQPPLFPPEIKLWTTLILMGIALGIFIDFLYIRILIPRNALEELKIVLRKRRAKTK